MLPEWLGSERPWLLLLLTLVCFFIYMCTVACFVGATELVILRTCPRSRTEIGSGPVFLDSKLSFNKAQAISVLTKRNRHAFN